MLTCVCLLLLAVTAVLVQPAAGDLRLLTPEEVQAYRTDPYYRDLALKGDKRPFCAAVGNAPAETWVNLPDEVFWNVMPSTRYQRCVDVGNNPFRTPKIGCPVHGEQIYEVDAYYPWIVDCIAAPYKLKCPVGGETYPSNDFAAGDLTSGDYPDDGNGYVDADGTRYHFIGLYAHYAYNTVLIPAIRSFGHAYLITGDKRYAHKAAICLLKEASEYPNSTDRKDWTYIPGYGKGSGMITDVVWSAGALNASALCYDEVKDTIATDAELLAFARQRLPGIATGEDLKAYIEDHTFRAGLQALVEHRIQPNEGWGQEAVAKLALLLGDFGDRHPNSLDALEWLYYGGGRLKTLGNQFWKDGSSYESTGYNDARLGLVQAVRTVERLRALVPERVPADRYPDMTQEEKLQRYLDTYRPAILALSGGYTISIGDGGTTEMAAQPRIGGSPERGSEFLDGYGLGILRSGTGREQRDVTLFYGGVRGHAHYDPLMLGMHGHGRDLLPNIGYPQSWNFAPAWEWSLLTHNTVVVDRDEKPCSTVVGSLTVWAPGEGCQVMEASKRPYRVGEPRGEDGPDVTDYRRLTALIDLDAQNWYALDVFRVTGGTDHLQSWHSGSAPGLTTSVEGVTLTRQERGTLAGEEVAYGARYTEASGRERWDPYCFLKDVARGTMGPLSAVTHDYGFADGLQVRLNFVPVGATELITARGGAPIAPDKDPLAWTLPHRQGSAGLRSQFVTVIEAYTGQRVLSGLRRLPCEVVGEAEYDPVALEVAVPGGRDILLLNGREDASLRGEGFSLTGKFGLVRERGGRVTELRLVAGSRLHWGGLTIEQPILGGPARISAVDRPHRAIEVEGPVPPVETLTGRRVLVDNHGERLSSYTIKAAARLSPTRVRLQLDSSGLLGEGIAMEFADGFIRNGPEIAMPLAGLVEIGGRLDASDAFYYGGHLETGKPGVDLKVRGVMGYPYQAWGDLHNAGDNHVVLCDPIPADRLRELIGEGSEFRIYEYGVGDDLRFDSVAVLRP